MVIILLTTLRCLRGKANFRHLSRYREFDEKTYSRWFRREFDLVEFNRLSLAALIASGNPWVAAMDCRFNDNSGKQTYGLDKFYTSQPSKAEQGLEISNLALVEVDYHTAYIAFLPARHRRWTIPMKPA